jgi:hypothetical protein
MLLLVLLLLGHDIPVSGDYSLDLRGGLKSILVGVWGP